MGAKKPVSEIKREISEYLRAEEGVSGPFRESQLGLPPDSHRTFGETSAELKRRRDARQYVLVDDDTGRDMRRAHDFEVDEIRASRHGTKLMELGNPSRAHRVRLRDTKERFSVVQRGKIEGTSSSVADAMSIAPPAGDAVVRGEYTSDGQFWGPGRGKIYAIREGKRWVRV